MPDSDSNPKLELLKAALEARRDEYRELNENWRGIDSKAQGAVAIAGIFIGGIFAFTSKRDPGSEVFKLFHGLQLIAPALLLLLSVIFAILSLRLRTVSMPPLGQKVERLATDLLQVADPQELTERLPAFIGDQMTQWRMVNLKVNQEMRCKADHLWRAQLSLLSAIILVVGLASADLVF